MDVDDDFIKREYEHQRQMADEEHRRKMEVRRYRREMTANVLMAAVALAAIAGVVWLIWHFSTLENPAEVACIETGGTWASINDGGPVCLRMEKQ